MPDPITTILAIAKNLKSLKDFIEDGELAHFIGDIELKAAKEALSKVKIANDKDAQTWQAISHLESSLHYFQSLYLGKNTSTPVVYQAVKRNLYARKSKWTLFLMAVCYKSLEEKKLLKKTISEAKEIPLHLPNMLGFVTSLHQITFDPRSLNKVEDFFNTPRVKLTDFKKLKKAF